jgi:hypothetical protein
VFSRITALAAVLQNSGCLNPIFRSIGPQHPTSS